MTVRLKVFVGVCMAAVAAGMYVYLQFAAAMRAAHADIARGSDIVDTAAGPIEVAEIGTGPALLMIHGSGGGFDQGLAIASDLVGAGFHIIAPSRFGYLRTPLPADISPGAQADALAALLDARGIDRATVIGVSAGARSAIALAVRHPGRIKALVLVVPATYAPQASLPDDRGFEFPFVLNVVNAGGAFIWWAAARTKPDLLGRFLGVPPAVFAEATSRDRVRLMQTIDSVEPLSLRFAGIRIDSQPELDPPDLASVRAPTLLISARDDLFGTAASATYAAGRIPNAELTLFESGGHLLVGRSDATRQRIRAFLAQLADQ